MPTQAAPRDALISDLAPAASRSACFGFAQSLRKWGSFMGAGLTFLLMRATGNNYQLIFTAAAGVTVLSTLAFVLLVPQHARPLTPEQQRHADAQAAYEKSRAQYDEALKQQQQGPAAAAAAAGAKGAAAALVEPLKPQRPEGFSLARFARDVAGMGPGFYRTLLLVCLYGLGHINESMLEARAMEVGFGKAESTLVVAIMALAVSVSAWPLGRLDDK